MQAIADDKLRSAKSDGCCTAIAGNPCFPFAYVAIGYDIFKYNYITGTWIESDTIMSSRGAVVGLEARLVDNTIYVIALYDDISAVVYDTLTLEPVWEVNHTGKLQGSALGTLRRRTKPHVLSWTVAFSDQGAPTLYVACKDRKSVQSYAFGRIGSTTSMEKYKYPNSIDDVIKIAVDGQGRLLVVSPTGTVAVYHKGQDTPTVIPPQAKSTVLAAAHSPSLGEVGVGSGVWLYRQDAATPLHHTCPALTDLLTRGPLMAAELVHSSPTSAYPLLTTAHVGSGKVTLLTHVVTPTALILRTRVHVPWVRGTPRIVLCGPVTGLVFAPKDPHGQSPKTKGATAVSHFFAGEVHGSMTSEGPDHLFVTAQRMCVVHNDGPVVEPLLSLAPLRVLGIGHVSRKERLAGIQYGRRADGDIPAASATFVDLDSKVAFGPVDADAVAVLDSSSALAAVRRELRTISIKAQDRKLVLTKTVSLDLDSDIVAIAMVGAMTLVVTSHGIYDVNQDTGAATRLMAVHAGLRGAHITVSGTTACVFNANTAIVVTVKPNGRPGVDHVYSAKAADIRGGIRGAEWRAVGHTSPVLIMSSVSDLYVAAAGRVRHVAALPTVGAILMPAVAAGLLVHPVHSIWDAEQGTLRPAIGVVSRPALVDAAFALVDTELAEDAIGSFAADLHSSEDLSAFHRSQIKADLASSRAIALRDLGASITAAGGRTRAPVSGPIMDIIGILASPTTDIPEATRPLMKTFAAILSAMPDDSAATAPPAAQVQYVFYEGAEQPVVVDVCTPEAQDVAEEAAPEPEPEPVASIEEPPTKGKKKAAKHKDKAKGKADKPPAEPQPAPNAVPEPETEPSTAPDSTRSEQDRIRASFLSRPTDLPEDEDEDDWGPKRSAKKFNIKIKSEGRSTPDMTLARGLTLKSLKPPPGGSPHSAIPAAFMKPPADEAKDGDAAQAEAAAPEAGGLQSSVPTAPAAVNEPEHTEVSAEALDALSTALAKARSAFSNPATYHIAYAAAGEGFDAVSTVNPTLLDGNKTTRALGLYRRMALNLMKINTNKANAAKVPATQQGKLLLQVAFFSLATWSVALMSEGILTTDQETVIATQCIALLLRLGLVQSARRVAETCGESTLPLVKDADPAAGDRVTLPVAAKCNKCGAPLLMGGRCSCGGVVSVDWKTLKSVDGAGKTCGVCGACHVDGGRCQTCNVGILE
ncbi:hypothetical protein J8273_3061 [Carpediemonas membranifera]|uniref:Uncharacterized protein n=1 Tax=Carpediemonas membranifera TaxID=201153 RepID=A0A8J6EAV6_9EUKA|nr:hypothetical protein J8273_3061 [Carpediemonas membranifera]|eukprot:KAG9395485.1 hypothetical protein J8273_3061 [Carpediemonas membranifera]